MEIIIHGKPLAGSFKSTPGIDNDLCNNIVESFFKEMNGFDKEEKLVVDARKWRNKWYTVYTYRKGSLDTSKRDSFFALSIIIPDAYYCLTSEVFIHLKKVYNNFVSGKYISQEGNYLVSDFSDSSSFDKIVSETNSKQFVNLEEPISNWITIEKTNPIYYNPIDCDSKKFIEDLKKYGRIIVSSSQTCKDELLEKTNLYINENNKLKQNLNTKNKEIEQLNNNIKSLNQKIDNLQNSINSSSISHDQDIKSLKDEIEKAKEEKRKIEAELSNQKNKYDKLEKEYNKLKNNIGSGVVPAEPKVQELAKYCGATMPKHKNRSGKILMFSQLILNFVILVFFVYLFFAIPSKKNTVDKEYLNDVYKKVEDIEKKQETILNILSSISMQQPSLPTQSKELDEDCGLQIIQDTKSISIEQIDTSKPVIIKLKKHPQGYEFHVSNLKGDEVEENKSINLKKINSSKPIIITYRSDNIDKLNPNNKIEIE